MSKGNVEDLTGQTFNRLTVVKRGENTKSGTVRWWCKCNCGNKKLTLVRTGNLKNNITKSCGCLREEVNKQRKKFNTYDLNGEYGIGYTADKKEVFYFDLEDYDKIKDYYWRIKNNYVVTSCDGDKTLLMHRIIMDNPNNLVVDHINHKENDNRKNNLRICTTKENTMNERLAINNTSNKTGVSFETSSKKWRSYININGKSVKLGTFDKKEDAIKARIKAEKEVFKQFSNKEQWGSKRRIENEQNISV